jgi:citrate synthase
MTGRMFTLSVTAKSKARVRMARTVTPEQLMQLAKAYFRYVPEMQMASTGDEIIAAMRALVMDSPTGHKKLQDDLPRQIIAFLKRYGYSLEHPNN